MIVAVLIGNSDDKLTQYRWSAFIREIGVLIASRVDAIEFSGFSLADAPWQNACWVFQTDQQRSDELRVALSQMANDYDQDSIAWIQSPNTEFIKRINYPAHKDQKTQNF